MSIAQSYLCSAQCSAAHVTSENQLTATCPALIKSREPKKTYCSIHQPENKKQIPRELRKTVFDSTNEISSDGMMTRDPVKEDPRYALIRFGVLTVQGNFSNVLSGLTFQRVWLGTVDKRG